MSAGDFKLELENATLRRLLEHAATDAARRDSAEKLQRLILEELHHRVKNTLAIVQSITNQSVRTACWEPSWLENIELHAKKAMKRENIDQEYSHV